MGNYNEQELIKDDKITSLDTGIEEFMQNLDDKDSKEYKDMEEIKKQIQKIDSHEFNF